MYKILAMRKTYITKMPDKTGAFFLASDIISSCGGNIVRVNYNKAVDIHTLFIEVSATSDAHKIIEERLTSCGYLSNETTEAQILMIVLTLNDVPGAVKPVLETINKYKVNISYISSQENGTGIQHFKMGLLIENTKEIKNLIDDISKICEIKILNYEVTDRLLDGTVFYVTFANEMRTILHLTQEETNELLIIANRLMQVLDEQNKPVLQTFDYIRRFAKFVVDHKGDNFNPQITKYKLADNFYIRLIEPPCGSNMAIMEYDGKCLAIDTGFACYKDEVQYILNNLLSHFDKDEKLAILTHADMDHAGLISLFDKVYLSKNCYDNFELETKNELDFRAQNPLHEPYCSTSRIISQYKAPNLSQLSIIGDKKDNELLSYIGKVDFAGYRFDVYEGRGGHVKGESVIVCDELKIIFSGDIFVNVKGFTKEQKEFNQLAPFLMTGVDFDPKVNKECREYLLQKYKGYKFFPGHGGMYQN